MIKGEEDLKRDQENGRKKIRSNKQPLKTALKVKVDLKGGPHGYFLPYLHRG